MNQESYPSSVLQPKSESAGLDLDHCYYSIDEASRCYAQLDFLELTPSIIPHSLDDKIAPQSEPTHLELQNLLLDAWK